MSDLDLATLKRLVRAAPDDPTLAMRLRHAQRRLSPKRQKRPLPWWVAWYGDGYRHRYGHGNGNGDGYGYGNGNGYGDGYGYGYGYGNGNGYGYGYGNGY